MHALSLLALLLPFVAADEGYAQCDCQTASGSGQTLTYNHDLSHWLCYHIYTNIASWSEKDGRCVATQQFIAGDVWQQKCIEVGVQQGYYAFDANGNPITNVPAMKVDTAVGNCD
ncbi:hypothetical protein E4U19_002551 [Claviceps sp. Clav32 group G5]|nr:hypothetical protein E4U40_004869 [Claviceps sp. LM458 group G5]KAG6026551.1 hypothetical protein E4U19_002551 [Claviceps sp. Clav32 group G5]KAG6043394.1 hypothetical protein E4U39_004579 [Claviceps sp. Clav50 group G5]